MNREHVPEGRRPFARKMAVKQAELLRKPVLMRTRE